MKTLLTGLSALFLSTALVACGGSSKSSDTDPKGAAETPEFFKVNPLASGKFPEYPLTIHSAAPDAINDNAYTFVTKFDPTKETFTVTVNERGQLYSASGTFDLKTGEMKMTNCDRTDCLPFDFDDAFTVGPPKLVGDGLVLIDKERHIYHAVSPAVESKMPAGRVTYEGKFYGDYSFASFYHGDTNYPNIEGKATTTVNFEAGQLDAKFHELTYDNVDGKEGKPANFEFNLKGAEITGNRFEGGTIELPIESGRNGRDSETTGSAIGGFFGEKASEVGGVIGAKKGYSYLDGAWTGVAQ